MTKNNSQPTIEELHLLIARYFDGETSVEEETLLRKHLAATHIDTPEVREAKAVMSYLASTNAPKPVAEKRRSWVGTAVKVAATVAILVAVAIPLLTRTTSSECYAYVNGERVNGDEAVEALMLDQMAALGEELTSADANSVLVADFGDAIKLDID